MDIAATSSAIGLQAPPRPLQHGLGRVLYGLPCAHCGRYYAASLNACPICNCRERVSALAAQEHAAAARHSAF